MFGTTLTDYAYATLCWPAKRGIFLFFFTLKIIPSCCDTFSLNNNTSLYKIRQSGLNFSRTGQKLGHDKRSSWFLSSKVSWPVHIIQSSGRKWRMYHRYRALSIFWFPFTQYLWSKPRINENFDFSFVTLRWGFLFILFGLLFWLWIISNYTKQNKWRKTLLQEKKSHFGWLLIPGYL